MNDLELLKSKGWIEVQSDNGYLTKYKDPFFGKNYSLKSAIKTQKINDAIDEKGFFYIVEIELNGYGFNVGKIEDKVSKKIVATQFSSLHEKTAEGIKNALNDGERPENIAFSQVTFNKILVAREKYGDRFFYVPTLDILYRAAIMLFRERVNGKFYYFENDCDLIKPDVSEEDIQNFQNKKSKEHLLRAWDEYRFALIEKDKNNKGKEFYQKAIKDEKGDVAWAFLRNRRHFEYENVDIVDCEEIN